MSEKNQTSEDVQVQHKFKHNFGESKIPRLPAIKRTATLGQNYIKTVTFFTGKKHMRRPREIVEKLKEEIKTLRIHEKLNYTGKIYKCSRQRFKESMQEIDKELEKELNEVKQAKFGNEKYLPKKLALADKKRVIEDCRKRFFKNFYTEEMKREMVHLEEKLTEEEEKLNQRSDQVDRDINNFSEFLNETSASVKKAVKEWTNEQEIHQNAKKELKVLKNTMIDAKNKVAYQDELLGQLLNLKSFILMTLYNASCEKNKMQTSETWQDFRKLTEYTKLKSYPKILYPIEKPQEVIHYNKNLQPKFKPPRISMVVASKTTISQTSIIRGSTSKQSMKEGKQKKNANTSRISTKRSQHLHFSTQTGSKISQRRSKHTNKRSPLPSPSPEPETPEPETPMVLKWLYDDVTSTKVQFPEEWVLKSSYTDQESVKAKSVFEDANWISNCLEELEANNLNLVVKFQTTDEVFSSLKDHMKQQEKTLGDLAIKKREKIKELKEQCCYWEENVIEIKKECLTLEKNLNSKGSHSENGILEKIEEIHNDVCEKTTLRRSHLTLLLQVETVCMEMFDWLDDLSEKHLLKVVKTLERKRRQRLVIEIEDKLLRKKKTEEMKIHLVVDVPPLRRKLMTKTKLHQMAHRKKKTTTNEEGKNYFFT